MGFWSVVAAAVLAGIVLLFIERARIWEKLSRKGNDVSDPPAARSELRAEVTKWDGTTGHFTFRWTGGRRETFIRTQISFEEAGDSWIELKPVAGNVPEAVVMDAECRVSGRELIAMERTPPDGQIQRLRVLTEVKDWIDADVTMADATDH